MSHVRRTLLLAALGWAAVSIASSIHAQPTSILHEFIPVDPREDLEFAATTPDGKLPAAIQTRSGVVEAPDTTRQPTATEKAYGEAQSARSGGSIYRPDKDTRRPTVARYDDPFRPSIAPYKRLYAYDMVNSDWTLGVADRVLRPVPEGGMARPGEDLFFGDITIDVVAGEAVRIPTVAPGARVLRKTVVPAMPLEILRDGADNWFVRGQLRARVRLVVEIAAPQESFGGDFPDRPLARTAALAPALPSRVAASAADVIRQLGLNRVRSLSEAVAHLVEYFRSFKPSDDPPREGDDVYTALALSRKGVCRHRAYAFLVTALGMGIPARMVSNEAHAWVEVYDGSLWRRIDLGGAADELQPESVAAPAHRAPVDPFPWPADADSGARVADRARAASALPSGSTSGTAEVAPSLVTHVSLRPPSSLTISSSDARVMRGAPLRLAGIIEGEHGPCAHVRVDVVLEDSRLNRKLPVGSLSTDETGRFRGAVVVPPEATVGDYVLTVATPGDARCGPGRSEP